MLGWPEPSGGPKEISLDGGENDEVFKPTDSMPPLVQGHFKSHLQSSSARRNEVIARTCVYNSAVVVVVRNSTRRRRKKAAVQCCGRCVIGEGDGENKASRGDRISIAAEKAYALPTGVKLRLGVLKKHGYEHRTVSGHDCAAESRGVDTSTLRRGAHGVLGHDIERGVEYIVITTVVVSSSKAGAQVTDTLPAPVLLYFVARPVAQYIV